MKFWCIKQQALIIITILSIFVKFITPVYSKQINVNSYAGKVTRDENYLINLQWWDNFNSPTLKTIIKQSINNCFDLQIAEIKVQEAQNYVESQKRNFFPLIKMEEGYRLAKPSRVNDLGWRRPNPIDFARRNILYGPLQVSYELDFWRKNKTEKEYFLQNKDFLEFEKRLITLTTVSEVASLYFNIVKNKELIALYQELNSLKKEKLNINKKKYELDLISKTLVIESEKELQQSEEFLLKTKALNEELKNHLDILVFGDKEKNNINYEDLNSLELFYDETINITTDKIAYRPDILMVEKEIKMAKLDADLARKALFPSFVLTGESFYITEMFKDYFSSQNAAYRFGGGFLYNLFEKGNNRSELEVKKNIYKQMLMNYEKTIISSINDVNNSLFYLKSSIKNLNNAKKISGLDKEYIDIQQQKLDMDLITYSEYIEAREKLIESQIAECEARTQCLIHTISLYKALGGNV